MSTLWRISNHCDLAGLGGERTDGRWHTAAMGKRIVYLSEHPAVALLETLVNLKGNPALFPEKFQLLKIAVADEVYARMTDLSEGDLDTSTSLQISQQAGDRWLNSKASALATASSMPSPHSLNVLLNPLHPDAAKVRIASCEWIKYDKRLFHLDSGSRP